MSVAATLLGPLMRRRLRKFYAECARAQAAQADLLRGLVARNQETHFLRGAGLSGAVRASDLVDRFRARVPIRDYEGLRPWMDRVIGGEAQVLTAEQPTMFNLTSGTTARAKLIPVTPTTSLGYGRLLDAWVAGVVLDHPGVLNGARLAVPGPAIEGRTAGGVPFGSASGQAYRQAPWWMRRGYAVPSRVFDVGDFEERYLLTARFALERDVSLIVTPNPATLLRLAEVVRRNGDALLRSIHDGTLSGLVQNPGVPATPPNPERARALARFCARRGSLLPCDYWPHLRLIGVWLGGSVGRQASLLSELFGSVPLRDIGFHASEARMTLPDGDQTAAGIASPFSNFMEFIPVAAYEAGSRDTLLMHELETEREYHVIVSNDAGLYRYDLLDVVRVTGWCGSAPRLAFVRKSKDMGNLAGEKLHVNHLLDAFTRLGLDVALSERRFAACADPEGPGYRIYLEVDGSVGELRALSARIDAALCEINLEYRSKRASSRLLPLAVQSLPAGTIEGHITETLRGGARDAQFKWRYLQSAAEITGLIRAAQGVKS